MKASETRERVVVRLAGDSGDGMQLAGGRFTDATALLGNDLATLPDFPAEIRAPAGTVAGVSAFQIHFAEPRHPDARRRARRAGRDEPGGAEGQPPGDAPRLHDPRQRGRVHRARGPEGRLRDEPARGRHARPVHRQADPDELAHPARGRAHGRGHQPRRAEGQEPVRARPAELALRPPDRGHGALDRGQVRRHRHRQGQPRRVPRGLELRRDVGADRRPGTRSTRTPTSSPAPTATSTAPRRPRSACSPRA